MKDGTLSEIARIRLRPSMSLKQESETCVGVCFESLGSNRIGAEDGKGLREMGTPQCLQNLVQI